MRKLFSLVAAAGLVLAAGPALAAPTNFTGSISVIISTLPPVTVVGSGVAEIGGAPGAATSIALPAGVFVGGASVPVTDPAAFPIGGVKASVSNGVSDFTGGGSSFAGPMAVQGVSNVCLFLACNGGPPANVDVPFTTGGVNGIGLGGAPIVVSGLVNVTVQGAQWTTGTATVMTAMGGSSTQMGSVNYSGDGTTVRLVTPVVINTNIGASPTLPAFGVLELSFNLIPEPGTMLLVASGVVGLGLLGRKRMSK